ncbi:hypothetical protein AXF42_Ash009701 [Apostasia shenzhenica]|uniref:Uncharacterized protein n=1 Tax=Apostasia shenzhenica TaxID=1088818 RepID=A0A2I0AWU6_9ASPA|nr:hypothetical protein AXF42_Ash009701 [Apostasia shenzhenica]
MKLHKKAMESSQKTKGQTKGLDSIHGLVNKHTACTATEQQGPEVSKGKFSQQLQVNIATLIVILDCLECILVAPRVKFYARHRCKSIQGIVTPHHGNNIVGDCSSAALHTNGQSRIESTTTQGSTSYANILSGTSTKNISILADLVENVLQQQEAVIKPDEEESHLIAEEWKFALVGRKIPFYAVAAEALKRWGFAAKRQRGLFARVCVKVDLNKAVQAGAWLQWISWKVFLKEGVIRGDLEVDGILRKKAKVEPNLKTCDDMGNLEKAQALKAASIIIPGKLSLRALS